VKWRKILGVKPLILGERIQDFDLKIFMQGMDEESLEKIAAT
jgi:hypothetical protein